MKRSTSVVMGAMLAAAVSFACASGEDDQEFMDVDADHQQVCTEVKHNGELVRVEDEKCPDENEHHAHFSPGYYYWYYLGKAHGTPPAVGASVPVANGSFTRPSTGTIARPPATGGFGVTKVSVGG